MSALATPAMPRALPVALLAAGLLFTGAIPAADERFEKVVAQTPFDAGSDIPWRYWRYLPAGYREDGGKRWPLLIWLHGRSLRGDDLERVTRYGPPSFLDERDDFPFVAVCPQLPRGSWPPDALDRLLAEWLEVLRVDPDRVYLSGVSLGAMGAWGFAAAHPDRFAALVPVCAHGPARAAKSLVDVPIWAFHGDEDEIVPIGPHRELIDALEENGGESRLTVMKGGDHGSVIRPVYRNKKLYQWLLNQRRTREN